MARGLVLQRTMAGLCVILLVLAGMAVPAAAAGDVPSQAATIVVKVVDSDNNPRQGLDVVLESKPNTPTTWEEVDRDKSGSDGTVTFHVMTAGTYRVRAIDHELAVSHAYEVLNVTGDEVNVQLLVDRANASGITGGVKGNNVATLEFRPTGGDFRNTWIVQADPARNDGQYSVALPEGSYWLKLQYNNMELSGNIDVQGTVHLPDIITSSWDGCADLRIIPSDAGMNITRVSAEFQGLPSEASPCADLLTRMTNVTGWITHGDRLEALPPGRYLLFVEQTVEETGEKVIDVRDYDLQGRADLALEKVATVNGSVTLKGSPAAFVPLQLRKKVGPSLYPINETRTGADGKFTVSVLPGDFEVGLCLRTTEVASPCSTKEFTVSTETVLTLKEPLELDDVYANVSQVIVTVRDTGGRPVPQAHVTISGGETFLEGRTEESGVYVFYDLKAGDYWVRVRLQNPSYPPIETAKLVTVNSNEETRVEFVLNVPEPEEERGNEGAPPLPPLEVDIPDFEQPGAVVVTPDSVLTGHNGREGVVIEAGEGQPVIIDPDVSSELVEQGVSVLTVNFEGMKVDIPAATLSLDAIASVNDNLRTIEDLSTIRLQFSMQRTSAPEPPTGIRMAGEAYDISLRAVADNGEGIPITWLPKPVQVTLPLSPEQEARFSSLWYVDEKGTFVPVPTWVTEDGALKAVLRHLSRYVIAIREPAFGDIHGHWAASEIETAYARGIVNGVEQSRFEPNRDVSRIEFTAMLIRALGLVDHAPRGMPFVDVNSSWAPVVAPAYGMGLVYGKTATHFDPYEELTRLELAVMMGRALKAHGFELSQPEDRILAKFDDGMTLPQWARSAVALAVENNIVEGISKENLGLGQPSTRAQTAAMVVRFLKVWLDRDNE